MRSPRVAEMPASAFHQMVGDPDIFVGGGSVAALTGAAAGATALLVMRLNARRKSLKHLQSAIQDAVYEVERIVDTCQSAADEDINLLAELLDAHRHARKSGDQTGYVTALTAAAESPIRISAAVAELLAIIEAQIEISTRFTVSDLGAAATLAAGSCQAALLTAEVNIALLLEHPATDRPAVEALDTRREELRSRAIDAGCRIEQRTRDLLRGTDNSKEII